MRDEAEAEIRKHDFRSMKHERMEENKYLFILVCSFLYAAGAIISKGINEVLPNLKQHHVRQGKKQNKKENKIINNNDTSSQHIKASLKM